MNKLLIAVLSLASTAAIAQTTDHIRTTSGDLVNIGDTEATLIQKMGSRPAPRFYVYENAKGYSCAATEYKYRIEAQQYTVTLCRGKVVQIDWQNI